MDPPARGTPMQPHQMAQQALAHATAWVGVGMQHLQALGGQLLAHHRAGDRFTIAPPTPQQQQQQHQEGLINGVFTLNHPPLPSCSMANKTAPALLLASISASASLASPTPHPSGPHTSNMTRTPMPLLHLAAALGPSSGAPGVHQPDGEQLSAERKAELGRATWTLLHMMASQFPDKPSRQQRRDARELIECLTRIYPCGSCASHFAQIVKRHPPKVNSRQEFQLWTCQVHNVVNRSLGKPEFNCGVVGSRWAPLDCGPDGPEGQAGPLVGCDMVVGAPRRGGQSGRSVNF